MEQANIYPYNLHTMYAIAFKLNTLVQYHKMTLYNKFHNSELNIYEIIVPLFDLEISVKLFRKFPLLKNYVAYAIAIKRRTLIQYHKVTLYTKFHTSEFNIN